ncbi:MAG: hypothetical protein AAF558_02635 [Verrucomicrobiota bacterium]
MRYSHFFRIPILICLLASTTAHATEISLSRIDWPTTEKNVLEEEKDHTLTLHLDVNGPPLKKAPWTLNVYNWNSKKIETQQGEQDLTQGPVSFELSIPSATWSYGAYDLSLTFAPKGQSDKSFRIPIALASPHDRFIVYESKPIVRGIKYLSKNKKIQTIKSKGHSTKALIVRQQSAAELWARSAFFTLTDDELRNGRAPVVDVTTVVRQTFNTGVDLHADTTDGSKKLGMAWGRSPNWRILRKQIDNAYLGARQHGNPSKKMAADGHDFRLNSFASDFAIRSFWVRTYPLDGDINWQRLIRFQGIQTNSPIYTFEPNSVETFKHQFQNFSNRATRLNYEASLETYTGETLWKRKGTLPAAAQSQTDVPIEVNTESLENGIYRLHLLAQRSDGDRETILNKKTNLAVTSTKPLPRAKDKEFLYGLDVINGKPHSKIEYLKWADFMGVDILRGFGEKPDPKKVANALEILSAYNLRSLFMIFPTWDQNTSKRKKKTQKMAQQMETLARQFKDQITYYELGNEPDLKYFYPGPMADYVEDYETVYDAIKRGNPDAQVMNGGLSFHMEEGTKRSREFVRLVDRNKIDLWAYHAHGPGIEAERRTFQKMKKAIKDANQVEKPLVDTETGLAARTQPQEWDQARTVIEKMVFSQSVGSPMLFFFRLHMFAGAKAYTMTYNYREPRPSVLSYRTLVSTLRHHNFESSVSLSHPKGLGFFFQQASGNGKAAVFWTSDGAAITENIKIGPGASEVQMVDMMGNQKAATLLDEATVALSINRDPIFLTWNAPGQLKALGTTPSFLALPSSIQASSEDPGVVTATISNPNKKALTGTLDLSVVGSQQAEFQQKQQTINVEAGSKALFEFPLSIETGPVDLKWPIRWTTFLEIDTTAVDLAKLSNPKETSELPSKLPTKTDTLATAREIILQDNLLDFGKLRKGAKEKRAAIAIAEIISTDDQTVEIGASADWWMNIFLNGTSVFDTMEKGNISGYALSDHTFEIDLKKGSNRIVFLVLSGSHGWKLLTGGPQDLLAARGEAPSGPPRIEATLRKDGSVISKATASFEIVPSPQTLPENFWEIALDDWCKTKPTMSFDPIRLKNPHEPFPDAERWYKGMDDLSGDLWIAANQKQVYLVARIRDNEHSSDNSNLFESDSLQIALNEPGKFISLSVGEDGLKTENSGLRLAQLKMEAGRVGTDTFYRIAFDRPAPGKPVRLNAKLIDRDGELLKQTMTLRDGWGSNSSEGSGAANWLQIP